MYTYSTDDLGGLVDLDLWRARCTHSPLGHACSWRERHMTCTNKLLPVKDDQLGSRAGTMPGPTDQRPWHMHAHQFKWFIAHSPLYSSSSSNNYQQQPVLPQHHHARSRSQSPTSSKAQQGGRLKVHQVHPAAGSTTTAADAAAPPRWIIRPSYHNWFCCRRIRRHCKQLAGRSYTENLVIYLLYYTLCSLHIHSDDDRCSCISACDCYIYYVVLTFDGPAGNEINIRTLKKNGGKNYYLATATR